MQQIKFNRRVRCCAAGGHSTCCGLTNEDYRIGDYAIGTTTTAPRCWYKFLYFPGDLLDLLAAIM